jgi:hypothetical protein
MTDAGAMLMRIARQFRRALNALIRCPFASFIGMLTAAESDGCAAAGC